MSEKLIFDSPAEASDAGYMSIKAARQYARETGRGGYAIRWDWIAEPPSYRKVDYPYDVWIRVQPGEVDFTSDGLKVANRYRREQIDALPPLDVTSPDRLDTLSALRALARGIDADTAMLRADIARAASNGVPIAQIADAVGADRGSIYRWIRDQEESS